MFHGFGDNYHREKRHVSPRATYLARDDGGDVDGGGCLFSKGSLYLLMREKKGLNEEQAAAADADCRKSENKKGR